MAGLKMKFSAVWELAENNKYTEDDLLNLFDNAAQADPSQITEYRRRTEQELSAAKDESKSGSHVSRQRSMRALERVNVAQKIQNALNTYAEQTAEPA